MPELPEVTTTVQGLNKTVVGYTIVDIWTDLAVKNPIPQFARTLKSSVFFEQFKKEIIGTKIKRAERRAKNILIHTDTKNTVLIHMKMTGHMMVGNYTYDKKMNTWNVSNTEVNEALRDPFNRFIHVVFTLQKGKQIKQLVLCDSRKFAKVTLFHSNELKAHTQHIGPEPLESTFTQKDFNQVLSKKPTGKIKTVLMDQTIIAGIGNIYSDEMLWGAGIHPERLIKTLTEKEYILLYKHMKNVLQKGIDFGGDSTSDYRNIYGERGAFQGKHSVYRKTHTQCIKKECAGVIQRKMIGGRSAHFCNTHQI